jgi:hypothetical protein
MYEIPQPIKDWIKEQFSSCNNQLAYDLSLFPGIREEALDNNFISYFSKLPGPFLFNSNWTIRIDAHFIGGGKHYYNWEVADIGLMIIFRQNGKIIRSKMVFLQSKKLYASTIDKIDEDPYNRLGMGRLLVNESEHKEITRQRLAKFEEKSKYKAFRKDSAQQRAMSSFERRFGINMYYLFYNPMILPHAIESPLRNRPVIDENKIGCRVIKKNYLDEALSIHNSNYIPSYGDLKYMLQGDHFNDMHVAGWRLEYFVTDLMLECKEGLIDNSPNFDSVHELLSSKSSPIAASLAITVDFNE